MSLAQGEHLDVDVERLAFPRGNVQDPIGFDLFQERRVGNCRAAMSRAWRSSSSVYLANGSSTTSLRTRQRDVSTVLQFR